MKKTQKNVTRIARKDKTETCTNRLKVKRNFKVKSLDEQHEISKKKSYKKLHTPQSNAFTTRCVEVENSLKCMKLENK